MDGEAKDTDSREAEKDATVHVGAGQKTLSVEQEAPPSEVRGLRYTLYPLKIFVR